MLVDKNEESTHDWQHHYQAGQEHQFDLRRSGSIIIPIILIILLVTMYAVWYSVLHGPDWMNDQNSWLTYDLWIGRMILTVIIPLVLMILGIVLIFRGTYGMMRGFFKPPDDTNIRAIIRMRLMGVPPLPPPLNYVWKYPLITFKEPKLPDAHAVCWLGGPATLMIYDGTALYLERGNRFSRVVGPGSLPMPFLERYETIRAVVDLRPQIKEAEVNAWSKDGIPVKMSLRMECQIDASDSARTNSHNLVYPFDPVAVKNAVEHETVKLNPKIQTLEVSDWVEGVWGQVCSYFLEYVIGHTLDELFLEGSGQIFTPRVSRNGIDRINERINNINLGAHLISVQITSVKVPQSVDEQRIANWDSERQRLAKIHSVESEARRILVREEIRTATQHELLNEITDRLRQVDPDQMTKQILLSLNGFLDQNLDDPVIRPLIAKESISLLEKIRKLLKEDLSVN